MTVVPEIVREAEVASARQEELLHLSQDTHQRLLQTLTDHGDEQKGSYENPDYRLETSCEIKGVRYVITMSSKGSVTNPLLFIGFNSEALKRTMVLPAVDDLPVIIADCNHDQMQHLFGKVEKMKPKTIEESRRAINLREADRSDLLQFGELLEFVEETERDREGAVNEDNERKRVEEGFISLIRNEIPAVHSH